MTLILTALTPNHIVQVSDRRVVQLWPSGRIEKFEGRIKAVITPVFSCSYTGSAELGGTDTAEWIALTLSDHVRDEDGGLEAVRVAAPEELRRIGRSTERLAIAFVGWTPAAVNTAEPLLIVLANFDIRDYSALPSSPAFTRFDLRRRQGRRTMVFPLGQPLTPTELVAASRAVRRLVESERATPRSIAQVLRETIQLVARSRDRTDFVSEDVLVTSDPRPDLLRFAFVAGKLETNMRSVTRIPPGPARREEQGGPLIVGDGGVWASLTPEEGPPGGGVFAGSRWIRVPTREGTTAHINIVTDPPVGPAWGFPGGTGD
jgi:hypothetical protein